jgi:hypothetical protein
MTRLAEILAVLDNSPARLDASEIQKLILWTTACLTRKNNEAHLRKRPRFLTIDDAIVINYMSYSDRAVLLAYLWNLLQ